MKTARQVPTKNDCRQCGGSSPRRVYCSRACRLAYNKSVRDEFKILTQENMKLLFGYDAINGRLVSKPYKTTRAKGGGIDTSGYRQLNIFRRMYLEHRLIWLFHFGEWPAGEIDHINHNILDNRIENLRVVDRLQNARNMPLRKNKATGTTGVRQTRNGKWEARIGTGGRTHLGTFQTSDEAISARRKAERELGFHVNHGQRVGGPA